MLLVYTFMLGLAKEKFGWLSAALMAFNWMIAELQLYKLTH
jgi:hypothetical protein